MFSSFLIHERRRPPLSAGVVLPTAQCHNCVVFNISSVERTEHALNNILYRESPLHRNYRKAKGKLSVLKIFPASVLKDGNQGDCTNHKMCITVQVCTNSDPLGSEDRNGQNAECNTMGKGRPGRSDACGAGSPHQSVGQQGAKAKRPPLLGRGAHPAQPRGVPAPTCLLRGSPTRDQVLLAKLAWH